MEEILCIFSIPVFYVMSFKIGSIIDGMLEKRWPTESN